MIHKVFRNKSIKYETFNVADDLPASSEILNKYAAKILKIRNLKQIDVKDLKGNMIKNFYKDSKKIKNFKQVCPKEMLDKLENPITLKNLRTKSA